MAEQPNSEDVAGALNEGLSRLKEGRAEEAEAVFRRLLDGHPGNADALHLLGVACRQSGKLEAARDFIGQAVAIDPRNPTYHANLGTALEAAKRPDEAMTAYRRAIQIKPDYAEALHKLGAALIEAELFAEAVPVFLRAVKSKPDYGDAYYKLGLALKTCDRAPEAAQSLARAVKLLPDSAEAHLELGLALLQLKRRDDAIEAFRRAARIKPDYDHALFHMGLTHFQDGDPAALMEACDACLADDPGNTRMLSLKAVAHNLLGQRDEARALIDFERFIRLRRFEAPDGYASLDDFNKTLVGDVCAHPTLQFERAGHATRNGRHTGNILIDADGSVKTLEGMIGSAVEGYLGEMTADETHPFLADPPRRWHLSAWAVVMDTQGYQLEHIHPAAWLSGCYYAQVPEAVRAAGDDHSGWIEFGQPEQSLRSDISSETTIHQPEEGLIVLFPSYFYHHTVPFTSTEKRVSIAFDVHRDA